MMANGGIKKCEKIKEVSVLYIDDSAVLNIIKPLDYLNIKGKKKNDIKNIQQKTKIKDAEEDLLKSYKTTNSYCKQRKHHLQDSSSEDESKEEDVNFECLAIHNKPTSLFEDNDVSGKQIFGFQTPKRKGAMVLKASESANKTTPTCKGEISETVTPKQKKTKTGSTTPLSVSVKQLKGGNSTHTISSKTPYSLRNKLKRRISAEKIREAFNSESDSSSDFNYDSGNDDTSQESSDSSSENDAVQPVTPRRSLFQKHESNFGIKRKKKDLNYVFTSDAYFESQASKVKTSDHTLSHLSNPRLTQDVMNSLLKNIPCSHESSIRSLINEQMKRFNSWKFALSQGYSILVYGLGSKKSLLNTFHKELLSNSLVLVVNGFFPSLTIKEVIDSIAGDLLDIKSIPPQPLDAVALIEAKLSHTNKRIFLIIHNLDGPMLRGEKTQTILSRLASIPRLYLIASVDHINCPLLWDQNKLSKYNFVWEDATSFLPYNEETSFETSLMVQRTGSLALASLTNVFKSLTKNAQEIFKLLLEDHISNKSNKRYIGLALSELYRQSRDAMLVTSDLALRTQLTEFLDHQLVKWRRDSEYLYIPIDNAILKQFQMELEDSDL